MATTTQTETRRSGSGEMTAKPGQRANAADRHVGSRIRERRVMMGLSQQQLANAVTLKTDTRGAFDGEVVLTRFDYLKDLQRNPFTVTAAGAGFTDLGKITQFLLAHLWNALHEILNICELPLNARGDDRITG